MEQIKKINSNILGSVILTDSIKEMTKVEKSVILESVNKYTIDNNSGEVKPLTNSLDITLIKNFLIAYCVFDSKIFDISNNDFKKAIKVAMTECFKMKLKRVDNTSELQSYQSEIANNSIVSFTRALLKAFINMNNLTIVCIEGNYRLIDIEKFNAIKMEANKQMWAKIKLDCEL